MRIARQAMVTEMMASISEALKDLAEP